jgi:SAM-dependent methyltransferase
VPVRKGKETTPRLYHELAKWFHLLTAPEDYKDEAALYSGILKETSRISVTNVLEMGSGGGNNASHMKTWFTLTLTDLSEEMLAISRSLNPECEHIQGDMRNMRLGRQFDAVFVHDAVSYIVFESDLSKVMETAFIHCKPGGVVLFVPDCTRETFAPATSHGGHDGDGRGLRYLEWVWDPDPDDTSYIMDFAYLFREGDITTCESDRHIMGLFRQDDWLQMMQKTGFMAKMITRHATWSPPMGTIMFSGVKS